MADAPLLPSRQQLATANALSVVDPYRAPNHVRIEQVDPRPDAQHNANCRVALRPTTLVARPAAGCDKREQHSMSPGIANLDLLDVDREPRLPGQHELVRDVVAVPRTAPGRESTDAAIPSNRASPDGGWAQP